MKRMFDVRTVLLGAVLLALAAFAHSETSDSDGWTLASYHGNRDQFTIDIPDGWHVIDQSPYSDMGVIAFYSRQLQTRLDKDPVVRAQQQEEMIQLMNDMSRGAVPTFFIDRYKADKGMTCAGFDARSLKKKLKIYSKSASLGKDSRVLGEPEVSKVDFGGCSGIKVLIRADTAMARDVHMLVYSAAANGITYDFALITEASFFAGNLSWFERIMATVRLAAAT